MRSLARGLVIALGAAVGVQPGLTVASLALQVLSAAAMSLTALFLKGLVDGAVGRDLQLVLLSALALAVAEAIDVFGSLAASHLGQTVSAQAGLRLEEDLMRRLGRLPGLEHFERPQVLDRLDLMLAERGIVVGSLNVILGVVAMAVRVTTMIGLLATVHAGLALLPILALPSLWTEARAQRILQRAAELTAEHERLLEHYRTLCTSPAPGRESRVFGWKSEIQRRDAVLYDDISRIHAVASLKAHTLRSAGWLVFAAGYAGAIAVAAHNALRGRATVGDVMLAVSLARNMDWHVGDAVQSVSSLVVMTRAVARHVWFREYAATEAARFDGSGPVPTMLREGICLEEVSFRYPDTDEPVLRDCNLVLRPGTVVAIVGENGEAPRVWWRLLSLRGWVHVKPWEVSGGTAGACGADGLGSSA